MQIITAGSYREGSITAITAEANRTGVLNGFFTTALLGRYSTNASRIRS